MINGILIVDKEEGFTSFDVIARLRRISKQKRIGHTGTLDPMATGVLPILFGKATSLSNMLIEKDKIYQAVIRLGIKTDTYDITGNVLEKKDDFYISQDDVLKCLNKFKGDILQQAPKYSAIKVNGKKLYELARKNIDFIPPTREVSIYENKLISYENKEISLRVHCSKGTYIRSLAYDIGEKLGVGATLSSLRRLRSGEFSIENSVMLDSLEDDNSIRSRIIGMDDYLSIYPCYNVDEKFKKIVENGGFLDQKIVGLYDDRIRIKSDDELIGLYRLDREKNTYRPQIMLKE